MPTPPSGTNRLASERSPYLLQHQHNPVDWHPWGEEAFAKARRERKPIFLSIGYSTCHWCHVMAHESFENAETAALMNAHFINIKVDREERPDVDRVYMTFVQATTGGGGWPMSVFLTPDLKPFVGGTYYPPEDRLGRPGFPTVLKRIADAWKNERASILEHGDSVLSQLREHSTTAPPKGTLNPQTALNLGLTQLTQSFDEEFGGFGRAPKFPRPVSLNFLLRAAHQPGLDPADRKIAQGMALLTLRKMADGGMHDHLGGGFHRYSVDRFWHVPHFEKMLYDQAQLTASYLEAFQITAQPAFAEVARDILDYVHRDLTAPEGGFYSAEDADSLLEQGSTAHGEGAFYTWTRAEITAILGPERADVFNAVYGVEEAGNAPEGSDPHKELTGKNTLIARLSPTKAAEQFHITEDQLQKILADSRRLILARRSLRPRPHLDDKVITAWNGLMISAFARAAQVFDNPQYLATAQRSARFLEKELWKDGSLRRCFRQQAASVPGFADDYAFLIQGLLDLYEADFDIHWLQWALELQKKQDSLFADTAHGGYFSAGSGDPSILLRMKEDYDGAEPSPNSISVLNLLRLAAISNQTPMHESAARTVQAFTDQLSRAASAMPQMLCALMATQASPRQIVIAGPPDDPATRALLRVARTPFQPHRLLLLADGGPGQQWLAERLEFLRTVAPVDGKPAAYVCENFTCQEPTTDPEKLRALLAR